MVVVKLKIIPTWLNTGPPKVKYNNLLISYITCGPGNRIYSKMNIELLFNYILLHSALWLLESGLITKIGIYVLITSSK